MWASDFAWLQKEGSEEKKTPPIFMFTKMITFVFDSEAMEQHRITCEEEGRYVGK